MPAFAMPFIAIGGRDAADFDRVIEEYAREPNGGLIILPSPNTLVHRLKGARPGELPVQVPTKFELVINPQDERGIP